MNFIKKLLSFLGAILLGGITLFVFVVVDRIFHFSQSPDSSYGFWGIIVPIVVAFLGYWICFAVLQVCPFQNHQKTKNKQAAKRGGRFLDDKSFSANQDTHLSQKNHTVYTSNDLNMVDDRWPFRVAKIGDQVEVYSYIKTPVTAVNRDVLFLMYHENSFKVTPTLSSDGSIWLYSELNNACVAKLDGRIEMCKDWIRRGDAIRCEFTGFKAGQEHVVLAFYRNEYDRLKKYKSVIVKLVSDRSEYAQGSIPLMVSGEKLSCTEDESIEGKVNVLDNCDEAIGRLPKKYSDIFNSDGFAGIFFDHADEDDNYNFVPYVRIFLYS